MGNKRIFYATQGVKLTPVKEEGDPAVRTVSTTSLIPAGLQSVGITTNFNLEKIFHLGQLELYDSMENNPEVEVTLNKIFDGTKPLFLMVMGGVANLTSGNIQSLQNNLVNFELFIHPDTGNSTAGNTATSNLKCTGMYASSFTYTFPTDGNATEEVTLLGSNKTWSDGGGSVFTKPIAAPATARRWKFNTSSSVFPTGDGGMPAGSPLTNVTVSFDLGRAEGTVYTLGSYEPYMRSATFPVEISTEITSLGIKGDFLNIDANSGYGCVSTGNSNRVSFKPIKFAICGSGANDSLVIDLGPKNKLNSVNYSGGDAGGGNVEISYSFTTDNIFSMTASGSFTKDGSEFVPLAASEPVPYTFGNDN